MKVDWVMLVVREAFLKISGKTFQPDFFPSLGGGFLFGRYNELGEERTRKGSRQNYRNFTKGKLHDYKFVL